MLDVKECNGVEVGGTCSRSKARLEEGGPVFGGCGVSEGGS